MAKGWRSQSTSYCRRHVAAVAQIRCRYSDEGRGGGDRLA